MIQDSGARRKFETGAVQDVTEGRMMKKFGMLEKGVDLSAWGRLSNQQ